MNPFFFLLFLPGDNNQTSNKTNLPTTEAVNAVADESNSAKSNASAASTTNEGAVKFVAAPLPKVNAWKVSFLLLFLLFHEINRA